MADVTTTNRKRSAPEDDDGSARSAMTTAGNKKRARVTASLSLGNIYDYEELELLGQGTYGVVVKARDLRTGETVAVKWIRGGKGKGGAAADLRAAYREAGCLAACRGDPNVVEIKDVTADADTRAVYLVTEFVGGGSLRSLQQRRGQFSESETRAYMCQLVRGASRIHGAGLVHRDIKPENVLVGVGGGALKICDFGLARPARPEGGKPFRDGWAGTRCYRAPEQVVGSPRCGPAVDLWALGCVMAELLTGEILFGGAHTQGDMMGAMLDLMHEFNADGGAMRAFDTAEAFRNLPKDMSLAGREVLAGLLHFDADERMTAAAALQHRWFAEDLA